MKMNNKKIAYVDALLKLGEVYLLGNYPSRDLQGGKTLACVAGSQKSEA